MAKTTLNLWIDADLKEAAKKAAAEDRRTLTNWLEQAIVEKLTRNKSTRTLSGGGLGPSTKTYSTGSLAKEKKR